MDSFNTYPKVYAMGHRYTDPLRDAINAGQHFCIQEKIDGSQFSFGVDTEGTIHIRTRGQVVDIDDPHKMFIQGVEAVKAMKDDLHIGWTYRAEYLQKPKHNVLAYGRLPGRHLVLYDVAIGLESYLSQNSVMDEAIRLNIDHAMVYCTGDLNVLKTSRTLTEFFDSFLEFNSILSGESNVRIEGIVIKAVSPIFGTDGKPIIAKYVSPVFKEKHQKEWKVSQSGRDHLHVMGLTYRTEARWEKALQHLKEEGQIEGEPKDIAALVKAVPDDLFEECAEEIAAALFKWGWPQIKRQSTKGLAEWYKAKLAEEQEERFGEAILS